jgi:curli biogenesis system outer membrane secretion channel CsgG
MFLPRKILLANFVIAAVLAPVAVKALSASPAGKPAAPIATPVPAPAKPVAEVPVQKPAETTCGKPVRVIYGSYAAPRACPVQPHAAN